MSADPTTAGGGTEGLISKARARAEAEASYRIESPDGRTFLYSGEPDKTLYGQLAAALARASAEQARVEAERDGWTRRAEAAEAESALLKKHISALRDALDRSEARYAEAQNGPNG